MYFLGGISALHITFQKTKNLNRRGAVSFGKKILICPILPPMSDLTPFYGTGRLLMQLLLKLKSVFIQVFFPVSSILLLKFNNKLLHSRSTNIKNKNIVTGYRTIIHLSSNKYPGIPVSVHYHQSLARPNEQRHKTINQSLTVITSVVDP